MWAAVCRAQDDWEAVFGFDPAADAQDASSDPGVQDWAETVCSDASDDQAAEALVFPDGSASEESVSQDGQVAEVRASQGDLVFEESDARDGQVFEVRASRGDLVFEESDARDG